MMKKRYLPLLAVVLFTFGCRRADKGYAVNYSAGGARAPRAMAVPEMAAAYVAYDVASEQMAVDMNMKASYRDESAEREEASLSDDVERKLAKRAYINIRTENLDKADASVAALMEKHGAYAASTDVQENYSRHYSIRVPSSEYNAFLDGTGGMGRILHRSESTEDVTLRYYDLEGRLATKRELLATFQSYLGKAKNIEEILSVEARLADLHNEIDGTGRELRNLANRVDYATVDLSLLGPVTSTPNRQVTLGEKIRELFGAFGGFLSTVAVVLVGIVIYGIPILLLLAIFFWLFFGKIGLLKKLWRVAAGKKVSQK
jgi:hypothetical protein